MNYNQQLNQLKTTFDKIESYDPKLNTGLRSLKNMGVWLCIYALTDSTDQADVIDELAEKAKLTQAEKADLKTLVDQLSQPAVLESVIKDYENAHGTFDLTTDTELNKQRVATRISAYQLDFLLPHLQVKADQKSTLAFTMENSIKFNWADPRGIKSSEYFTDKETFRHEETDFLTANSKSHQVLYSAVEFDGDLYHVAQLGTLQAVDGNAPERTHAYIIEPVDEKNIGKLQKHYFDIISQLREGGFDPQNSAKMAQAGSLPNVSLHGEVDEHNTYRYVVSFPQIAATLKTTEQRLGVYAPFEKKTIASIHADDIEYLGKRELNYDKTGGEIYNKEAVSVVEMTSMQPRNYVTLDYTVRNPFMMVYEANQGADYYPYMIADPTKALALTFDASQTYPAQQATKEARETKEASASQRASFLNMFPGGKKAPETECKDEAKAERVASHTFTR